MWMLRPSVPYPTSSFFHGAPCSIQAQTSFASATRLRHIPSDHGCVHIALLKHSRVILFLNERTKSFWEGWSNTSYTVFHKKGQNIYGLQLMPCVLCFPTQQWHPTERWVNGNVHTAHVLGSGEGNSAAKTCKKHSHCPPLELNEIEWHQGAPKTAYLLLKGKCESIKDSTNPKTYPSAPPSCQAMAGGWCK